MKNINEIKPMNMKSLFIGTVSILVSLLVLGLVLFYLLLVNLPEVK